jgi:hypothetical protein
LDGVCASLADIRCGTNNIHTRGCAYRLEVSRKWSCRSHGPSWTKVATVWCCLQSKLIG